MPPYDPTHQHRRSIRLPAYDYTQPGAYFVTLCTQGRTCWFGEVVGGEMRLSAAGRIVAEEWRGLAWHFPHIRLGEFMVMPNHAHGIIFIDGKVGATLQSTDKVIPGNAPLPGQVSVGPGGSPVPWVGNAAPRPAHGPASGSLGVIIGRFKSRATKRIRTLPGMQHIAIWQRNYYEHILRDERDLAATTTYIQANPARWDKDDLRPNP